MNLCLELSICRICSEMMKLIRVFLAYFMWIRCMEDVCGDVGDSDGHVGGPRDLEDVRKKRKSRHSVIFFEFAVGFAEFFFCHWLWPRSLRSTRCPTWKPGGSCPQSTIPAPPAPQASRLTTALTVTTRCDRLPACEAL